MAVPVGSGVAVISNDIGVPDAVEDRAGEIVERAVACDSLRTDDSIRMVVGAASVLLACRVTGTPRPPSRIARAARVDEGRMFRAVRRLTRELSIPALPVSVAVFADRFAGEVGVCEECRESVARFARSCMSAGAGSSRASSSVAAAVVYVAARECGCDACRDVRQVDVAGVSGVSRSTLQKNQGVVRGVIRS